MATEGAALVTGGARRIGAHLVRALAGQGYAVRIHHRASAREAEALAAEIDAPVARRRRSRPISATPRSSKGWWRRRRGRSATMVLVNNAATFERDRATDFTLEAVGSPARDQSARAPVVLAREFARRLPAGADGLVVNLLDERIATPSRG